MQIKLNNSEIYQQRAEKLEYAKLRIDEIKSKVNGLEKELLEIKKLDSLLIQKRDIKNNRRDTIYKVDEVLFLGELMFQRFPNSMLYTWEEAKEYAQHLQIASYTGWRLPTVEELEKLLTKYSAKNSKGENLFIVQEFLEVLPKDGCFWTSSEENDLYAWVVDFDKGYDYWRRKTLKYYTLYVRKTN